MKIFISYSHKDFSYLERLHTHLSVLKREGKITTWYDREILGGGLINKEIEKELEQAELYLALVSPDFLASSYCYDKEMITAIKKAEESKLRIFPIILEPCDWIATPLQKFKALPLDGKPISEWNNQNTAFLEIVNGLRKICDIDQYNNSISNVNSFHQRQYRTKKDFDEIDRSKFKNDCFKIICNRLKLFIEELNEIENIKTYSSEIMNSSFSCTILNKNKINCKSCITIHLSSPSNYGLLGDIYFSFSENAPINTSNGGFNIVSDDYDLFLEENMLQLFNNSNRKEKLSPEEAANQIWNKLLEQAGISYT